MSGITLNQAIHATRGVQDREPLKTWRMYPNGLFRADGYILDTLAYRADEDDEWAFHFAMTDTEGGAGKIEPIHETGGVIFRGNFMRRYGESLPHLRQFHLRPTENEFPRFVASVEAIKKAQKTRRKIFLMGTAIYQPPSEGHEDLEHLLFKPENGFDRSRSCPHVELTHSVIERTRVERFLSWF